MRETAYLSLGGNLGDVRLNFISACRMIEQLFDTKITARSKLYRTPPWGLCEQPDFLNACLKIETALPPEDLVREFLEIEHRHGRKRGPRYGPRTLDIDLLSYGNIELKSDALTLPHPSLFERAFVLLPLADIAAEVTIAGRKIFEAARACDSSGITPLKEAY